MDVELPEIPVCAPGVRGNRRAALMRVGYGKWIKGAGVAGVFSRLLLELMARPAENCVPV